MGNLTPQATRRWAAVPMRYQTLILNNVWCARCRSQVTMLDYSGRVEGGMLVLSGRCDRCGGDVARVVEGE